MSAKPRVTSKPKLHIANKPKPELVQSTPDPDRAIREMRSDIFLISYRMQATVADAIVATRSGLKENALGHLQEMQRILLNTMEKYRR